jgi:nuclear cap-binding protein subunit 1
MATEGGRDKKRNGAGRSAGPSGEKPSEDHVEKLEEKLEAAQADQKNLFLIIFQVQFYELFEGFWSYN